MKLNKDTKYNLEIGDILESNGHKYIVTNIIPSGKGFCITIADTIDKRQIYAMPVSTYYGMNIIKEA